MSFTPSSNHSADAHGVHSEKTPGSASASQNATSDQTLLLGMLHLEHPTFWQQLLTGLGYEDLIFDPDLEAKIRAVWTLPSQDQDLVVAIIKHRRFHAWITATVSTALLINVSYDGPTTQQLTSFICAKLVDSISRSPQTSLPLVFFCGEHRQKDDPDSAPDGMMRGLLAQLLLAYRDFDLGSIQRMQNLDFDDVNDLCHVFDQLIDQLPHNIVVFCVIDAISFYEDKPTVREEASILVQALAGVAERTRETGGAFKLLLTSPRNTKFYKDMVYQEADVLWMPDRVERQGGFTDMEWRTSVDSKLAVIES